LQSCSGAGRFPTQRIADFWHACGYVHELAEALFGAGNDAACSASRIGAGVAFGDVALQ
jgi:hypothetical protein